MSEKFKIHRAWAGALLLLVLALGSPSVLAQETLTITVVNEITGAPVAGLNVLAVERVADGSSVARAAATTDARGEASYTLDGLGSGRSYYLHTEPYNGGWVSSADLTSGGAVSFPVGSVQVTVRSGIGNSVLAGADVFLGTLQPDGSTTWITRFITDGSGVLRMDPGALDTDGAAVVLGAISPVDGSFKTSSPITGAGIYDFVVGGPGLSVRVSNALSGEPLAGLDVEAYERLADGSGSWRQQATTDGEGRVTFDLDGLGSGRVYYLSAQPYNGGTVNSEDLTTTGTLNLHVGRLQVTLRRDDGSVLPDRLVYVGRQKPDHSVHWVQSAVTDPAGRVRLDPKDLDNGGAALVMATNSPIAGAFKLRAPIIAYGAYDFVVRSTVVTATVVNALSGVQLSNLKVTAMERMADGSSVWRAQANTDAQGQVTFDLDGLGAGGTYYLLTEPYNAGSVVSNDIVAPGKIDFPVGRLQVAVRSGVDATALSNTQVLMGEEQADGSVVWVQQVATDAMGVLRLDPPGLGTTGPAIVFAAISPADGRYKLRAAISSAGNYEFVVGGAGLQVTLVNAISGAPLPAAQIVAFERLADGTSVWQADGITDAMGVVHFDLQSLDDGRPHYLSTLPYNGGRVESAEMSTTGAVVFAVGAVPVTLIDGTTAELLPGRAIVAFRKLPDGSLAVAAHGTTDATGTVHFDLPGLDDDAVYLMYAHNPLGLDKHHLGPLITEPGAVSFLVDAGGGAPVDLTPPSLTVAAPAQGAAVAGMGFRVHGYSSDGDALLDAVVRVIDPKQGSTAVAASLSTNTGAWSAQVPASAVTLGETVTLEVTVRDTTFNEATRTLTVSVAGDTLAPRVDISSHAPGQSVPTSGFIVSGNAFDNTAVVSLTANLVHSALGTTVDRRALEHAPGSGRWSFTVPSSAVSSTGSATVLIQARDAHNNIATASVVLQVTPRELRTRQLVNRITFGATPQLLDEVVAMGADRFLAEQLMPQGVDDSVLEAMLPAQPPVDIAELQARQITRAAYSKRQLLETMTLFWENHFNTDIARHGVISFEYEENLAFRANALGRFRDLLGISASSPAMLLYLDSAFNIVGAANENYARELMELHTLGVDGGFTEQDVYQAARAFTGWSVHDGAFRFIPEWHDNAEKVVLGHVILAGGGVSDGDMLLDLLAEHPSTATNICRKLALRFVSDDPLPSLVEDCADRFMQSKDAPDQIAQTLAVLLSSPEFEDPSSFRVKLKTPLAFTVGLVRSFSATGCCDALPYYLNLQGMSLFNYPIPTGFPLTGERWLSSSRMLEQIHLLQLLAFADQAYTPVDLDPVAFFKNRGFETSEGIVGFLLELAFDGDVSEVERELAFDILDDGTGYPFWLEAPDAQQRLRRLLATVLAFPSYQYH